MKGFSIAILLLICKAQLIAQTNFIVAGNTYFGSTGDVHITSVNTHLLNQGQVKMSAGAVHLSGDKELMIGGVGSTQFFNLSLSNTKKSYYLENDLKVESILEMRNGAFDLDNFNLYLGEAEGRITGETEMAYITATGQGEIVKPVMLTNPNELDAGNLGLTLTANHNFGYTEIRRGHDRQQLPASESIGRYYYMVPESFPDTEVTVGVDFLLREWYGPADQQFQIWTKDTNFWEALNIQNEKYNPGSHYSLSSTANNQFIWVTVGAEEPFEETLDEVPTAFTPNGDGKNDTFVIPWIYKYPTAIVMIFNRWGDKIYTTNDYANNAWDGTFKGKVLTPNSFYYTVSFPDKNKGSLKGNISIVK
ncbi:gliding motility-associated-like protein [Roseivirga pacifica]|uniref:Gliding motility-associated C-terminal domain-containing protein n=1 Tax=Roseivirga pacifica TaxID=1267423 RepID=A0A1I0Q3T7_9BACT|nr:gliding motility-associated C-terminal domain-containing protein [Roseivirga pacifica]RKQ43272.1 gliding motility-associated-like protein [Roseivirga pacifica]SEW21548.1 gliding motility-associated C-terminal domain-containing protein [Roseivirga pacifica]